VPPPADSDPEREPKPEPCEEGDDEEGVLDRLEVTLELEAWLEEEPKLEPLAHAEGEVASTRASASDRKRVRVI